MKKTDEPLTVDGLVALAKARHDEVMAKAEKLEKQQKEQIAEMTAKEKELKKEIGEAKEQLETMASEFEVVERKQREKALAEIKSEEMTEDDLKSGKITIAQFEANGKDTDEVRRMALAKTVEILERSSDAARSKGEEIVRFEKDLYDIQDSIYSMLMYPIKLWRQSYRDVGDMLDFQFSKMAEGGSSARALSDQKKNEVMLIESGISISSTGYVWSNLSLKDAYRVRFDPILPKEHIVSLLEELDGIPGTERTKVTITYRHKGSHWPGDPINVMVYEEE